MSKQCQATNKHGRPCRLAARPGSDFCDTFGHGSAAETLLQNTSGRAAPPPERAGGTLAAPDISGDPWAMLRELPAAPPPAMEETATAPEAGQMAPPPADLEAEPDAWQDQVPALVAGSGDVWNRENTGALVNPLVDVLFEATGKKVQTARERELTGEAFAKMANRWLADADPNSPWGALVIWSIAVPGHRYLPDLVGKGSAPGAAPAAAPAAAARPADDLAARRGGGMAVGPMWGSDGA